MKLGTDTNTVANYFAYKESYNLVVDELLELEPLFIAAL